MMDMLCTGHLAMKATPHEDGGRRLLYIEPSNEVKDLQGEIILQKALLESANYFLAKGNLDTNHWTKIPPFRNKDGNPIYPPDFNPDFYEIGIPVEVKEVDGRVVVIGEIRRGESHPDWFWSTLTTTPPHRWYPSVGAHRIVSQKDPARGAVVTSVVRWINIGMCKEPVVPTTKTVELCDPEMLAKAISGVAAVQDTALPIIEEILPDAVVALLVKGVEAALTIAKTAGLDDAGYERLLERASSVIFRNISHTT